MAVRGKRGPRPEGTREPAGRLVTGRPRPGALPHVERVALADLQERPDNPRRHSARDVGFLQDVIQRVGAARSGVLDENNVVLAGHGFREASMNAGLRDAIIIDADGSTPVFVRRTGLTPEQKDELVVADNRAAQLSSWDPDALRTYAERAPTVRAGWSDAEWADDLAAAEAAAKAEDAPTGGDALGTPPPVEDFSGQCGVIVICKTEDDQRQIFERLTAEGLDCRVVNT